MVVVVVVVAAAAVVVVVGIAHSGAKAASAQKQSDGGGVPNPDIIYIRELADGGELLVQRLRGVGEVPLEEGEAVVVPREVLHAKHLLCLEAWRGVRWCCVVLWGGVLWCGAVRCV